MKPAHPSFRAALDQLRGDLVAAVLGAIREVMIVESESARRREAARPAPPRTDARANAASKPAQAVKPAKAAKLAKAVSPFKPARAGAPAQAKKPGRPRRASIDQLELFGADRVDATPLISDPEALLDHAEHARDTEGRTSVTASTKVSRARVIEPEPDRRDGTARFVVRPGEDVLRATGGGLVLRRRSVDKRPEGS